MISNTDIKQLASLARLNVTDEQCSSYAEDFNGILAYIDTISRVDLKEHKPSYINTNVVREDDDSYEPKVFTERLLKQTPESQDGYLKVPNIL